MTTIEGNLSMPRGRFGLVAAKFNQEVVEKLVAGAMQGLREHGVEETAIDLAWVPGCFEIPLIAKRLAASGHYVAVICLGAVIRGETDHYEHICNQAAAGVAQAALATGV